MTLPLYLIFKHRPKSFQNAYLLSEEDASHVQEIMNFCIKEYKSQNILYEVNIMSKILGIFVLLFRNYQTLFPMPIKKRNILYATKIQAFIDKYYVEELSLENIANDFHINKYHLLDIFKETTGYTIKQ